MNLIAKEFVAARAPLTLRGFPERHDAKARVKHPGFGRVAADAVS